MSAGLASKLKDELFTRYSLTPSDQWLNQFLASNHNLSHPIAALTSTAHFRLLSTDFTNSLSTGRGQCFPSSASDVNTKEMMLTTNIPVQVLDIQDTSSSKWSQVEAIERIERGEEIRGREVIRNIPSSNDDDNNGANGQEEQNTTWRSTTSTSNQYSNARKGSNGPHKLLLQDAAGTKIWAFELARMDRITIVNPNPSSLGGVGLVSQGQVEGMQIGCKLLLKKGTKVRRALLMLTPVDVSVMGGKVDVWDQRWREGRKGRLTQELEVQDDG